MRSSTLIHLLRCLRPMGCALALVGVSCQKPQTHPPVPLAHTPWPTSPETPPIPVATPPEGALAVEVVATFGGRVLVCGGPFGPIPNGRLTHLKIPMSKWEARDNQGVYRPLKPLSGRTVPQRVSLCDENAQSAERWQALFERPAGPVTGIRFVSAAQENVEWDFGQGPQAFTLHKPVTISLERWNGRSHAIAFQVDDILRADVRCQDHPCPEWHGLFGEESPQRVWSLSEGTTAAPARPFPPSNAPANGPQMAWRSDTVPTPERLELGEKLFFTPSLSKHRDISCGSCHKKSLAFADGSPTSTGTGGAPGVRNSPSLVYSGFFQALTWNNPQLATLENQMIVPLVLVHPTEHGLSQGLNQRVESFNRDPEWASLFAKAFPDFPKADLSNCLRALGVYIRSLPAFSSPWDRERHLGEVGAMTQAAKRGESLFMSARLGCASCHTPPLFTDAADPMVRPSKGKGFHNTGLYNTDGKGSLPEGDRGVIENTDNPEDYGLFRTPSLRNVAITAPYFHDGSAATLKDVLAHYKRGGRLISSGPNAGDGKLSPLKSEKIQGFSLSPEEEGDLMAFLQSLTDAPSH